MNEKNVFFDSMQVEKESMDLDSLDILFFLLIFSFFSVIFEDEELNNKLFIKILDINDFLEKSCLVENLCRN